jgi:hypothetical protein
MAPKPYSATAPIKALKGSETNPSVTFSGDEDTGLYSSGNNEICVSADGSKKAKFNPDGLEINGDLNLDSGGLYSTTLQLVTPTANRSISFPDQTGTVGLVGGYTGHIQYNVSGKLKGTSDFVVDPDWNNAATTFTGLKLNVTDTASAANSKLLDLQVGGVSKFSVTPEGPVSLPGNTSPITIGPSQAYNQDLIATGSEALRLSANSFVVSIKPHILGGTYLGFSPNFYGGNTDLGLARDSAGVVKITDGSTGTGYLKLIPTTVSSLTAAATVGAGTKAFVTDSTSTLSSHHGQTVVGGGSNFVPVFSDGTNWIVG